jgi:anti-anti-sigma regulatory factor
MKYALHFGPDAMHVDLEGAFTFWDTRAFRVLLGAIGNNHGRAEIRLNVSRLISIDASALALLMTAHDMAKKQHCPLVFEQPQGQVQAVLSRAARFNALNFAA